MLQHRAEKKLRKMVESEVFFPFLPRHRGHFMIRFISIQWFPNYLPLHLSLLLVQFFWKGLYQSQGGFSSPFAFKQLSLRLK